MFRTASPHLLCLGIVSCMAFGPTSSSAVAQDTSCARVETKRPLFGDLHVHTSYSLDAYLLDGVRNDPWDAYAFARGEELSIPRLDGLSERVRIDQPLDFAAVTDHDGFLGDGATNELCSRSSPWDDSTRWCPRNERHAWLKIQKAAEDYNSPCEFTTFVAYEWTKRVAGLFDRDPFLDERWTPGTELHRNIIFRNANVIDMPIRSSGVFGANAPYELWSRLSEQCGGDCDVLAIPHNPNLSNGFMFPDVTRARDPLAYAVLKSRFEPLVEIMQHKGASECLSYPGILRQGEEACDFEERNVFTAAPGGEEEALQRAEQASKAYVREALNTGLSNYEWLYDAYRIPVNPYQMGFIGSTDGHNATPGAVSESQWKGHHGVLDSLPRVRIKAPIEERLARTNPGAPAVVWAEKNTRDAIFDALIRRETYATSGPRITLRVFAGWDLADDTCMQTEEDWVADAYKNPRAVSMGGQLSSVGRPDGRAGSPTFVISVSKAVGTPSEPGNPLEQIEIVKGWIGEDGQPHNEVVDVFPGPSGERLGDDAVDLSSCRMRPEHRDAGFSTKCVTWRDESFDADRNAFYYVRISEVPSCRWSRYDELRIGEESTLPLPDVIRERAWSSPIWIVSE